MGEDKKKVSFMLPNEKVKVKFIPRKRGMASGPHVTNDHVISGNMLEGAVRRFLAPLSKSGGIMNVLTSVEKKYLEEALGLNLSVYGDFWKSHAVTLRKQETDLDLSVPMEFINFKILEHTKDKIVVGWGNRHKKLTYDFVIVKDGEVLMENKKSYDIKKMAWKEYSKIESEQNILYGLLKLLTKRPVSKKSKMSWLQNQIEKIVDERPKDFVNIIKNPSFVTQLMVNDAVDLGVIIREGNKYSTADGIELCEEGQIPIFQNTINFLDDPKHQDVRSMVQAKMNNAKE